MLEKNINPYLDNEMMPIIIGGDFNSGSHLDWTERAKHLYNGYVAEELPTSGYMYKSK